MIIGVVAVVCLVLAQFAVSIPGGEKSYEIESVITTPEYRTDAARAIDAYERLMERYMDLTARQLLQVGADCQAVTQRLDSLDTRLEDISARLAGIEKAMGIAPPQKSAAVEPNDASRSSSGE